MLLAVDIGNTQVVFGLYEGEDLLADWRMATEAHKTSDEYAVLLASFLAQHGLTLSNISEGVIACVVPPLLAAFEGLFRNYLEVTPLVVGPGVKTGVPILYDDPREVGGDRVANAVAARHLHGLPAIIIDFSTATVFDAISAQGEYLGGAIAPGLSISSEALFRYAARLPRVELVAPGNAIGRNNLTSMQSGLIYGYVGLVEGMITRFQRELGGRAQVIATGNLAAVIAREIDAIEIIDPRLTLKGLKLIYEMNR